MDEDVFDRVLRREDELRAKLKAGEIDEDELDAMRGFDRRVSRDIHLSLDQARRLVEEGAEPGVVAEIVGLFPRISIDEAIDLVVEYELEAESIRDLVRSGLSPDLDGAGLAEICYHEICADLLGLVVRAGFDQDAVIATAIELTEQLCDPWETLRSLERADLRGLTVDQIAEIADNEINPRVVRRLLDGDQELDVDSALRLILNQDEDGERPHHERQSTIRINLVGLDASRAMLKLGAKVAKTVAAGLKTR